LAGAYRCRVRCGSGIQRVGVGAWPPGRTPHRRAGRSIAAPAHPKSLGAPGVRARLCWSIACAAPAPPRARQGGRAVGRRPRWRLLPRVRFVSACSKLRKFSSHTEWVADGAPRVVCVQKRVTRWSRRTSPSSGRSSPSVSALPVLLALFLCSPPCVSIALTPANCTVVCRAEKGRGSTHEGKVSR
jgi:hypothetical protein